MKQARILSSLPFINLLHFYSFKRKEKRLNYLLIQIQF